MKLILCVECGDVVRLIREEVRYCSCGKSSGHYIDDVTAWYRGDHCVPLGIANNSLAEAVRNQPEKGLGEYFTAFVIPFQCKTFKRAYS